MIKAAHNKYADFVFNFYITWLLKRHFHGIYLYNEPAFPADKSILMLPNHSSWWDGFFIYFLNKKIFKRQVYLMMLEEELAKNKFFSRIGAFSIRKKTFQVRESLAYAYSLLSSVNKPLVCIFPQGELLPWGKRPLGFERGVEFLLSRITEPLTLCMLAMRIEFRDEQYPDVFLMYEYVNFEPGTKNSVPYLEDKLASLLTQLSEKIQTSASFTQLLKGRESVNRKMEKWKTGDQAL